MSSMRPVDHVAEKRLVGLVLRDARGAADALRDVPWEAFSIKEAGWIWFTVQRLHKKIGVPSRDVLLHALGEEGAARGVVEAYGDLIDRLSDDVDREENSVAYYAEKVLLRREARRLIEMVEGSSSRPGLLEKLEEDDVAGAIEVVRSYAVAAATRDEVDRGDFLGDYKERRRDLRERMKNPEQSEGFRTGIEFVDRRTKGLREQEFGQVIGGTGDGKTSTLVHIAHECWQQGANVAYVTIEMPKHQVQWKLDARVSGIDYDKFRDGTVTREELGEWGVAIDKEFRRRRDAGNLLYVLDLPEKCTTEVAESYLDQTERELRERFDVVMFDHLGLMSPIEPQKGGRLSWESMAEVANDLKFLGRRRRVVPWAAVQAKGGLSKQRRESADAGSVAGLSYLITQPADLVLVVAIEDDDDSRMEVHMKKWRHGYRGFCAVAFDGATSRLSELPEEDESAPGDAPGDA